MDRDTERKAGKAMTLGMSVFALVFSLIWCAMVHSLEAQPGRSEEAAPGPAGTLDQTGCCPAPAACR